MLKALASTKGLGTAHGLGSAHELGSAGTVRGKTGPPEVPWAGAVAVGLVPVFSYRGLQSLCPPRKSSGSVALSQLFSPENS